MRKNKIAIIIPVYNEEKVVVGVVNKVLKHFPLVVCVDDGSTDSSADLISKTKTQLVKHPINMGQGAALQTGIEFAREYTEAEYFVTFDADGQHRIEDVKTMLAEIKKGKEDIILGSRFLGSSAGMKFSKLIVLKLAVWFSKVTSGLHLTDTHNGLRVFNRFVAEGVQLTMADMAHASEFLEIIAKNKYTYKEVPVVIEYTEYSLSKGQSIVNAINIGFDMILKKASK